MLHKVNCEDENGILKCRFLYAVQSYNFFLS